MKRLLGRLRALSLLTLLLALSALPARAAGAPAGVPHSQVQLGFQPDATPAAAYATDHVLVKLTPAALAASSVAAGLRYGQAARTASFGLAGLDRVLVASGATGVGRAIIEAANADAAGRLGLDRWMRVDLDGTQDVADVNARLAGAPGVEAATLDYTMFLEAVPSDPLYAMHWGHNNTHQMLSYNWANRNHETGSPVGTVGFDANAQAAWDGRAGYGSSSVIIAIIDTGVQTAHPDLSQVTGYDFGDNDTNPDDNSTQTATNMPGHGTACAGIAAARVNSLGSAGIAPGCSIMPLKVVSSAGVLDMSAVTSALVYAADHGAKIISMSFGSESPLYFVDPSIQYAADAGCVLLAATGNKNASTIDYPASNPNVIAVGAASPCGERKRSSSLQSEVNPGYYTDPNGYTCDGERWWGSNYGTVTQGAPDAVDVIAPTILPTTDRLGANGYTSSDYYNWFNGTSCATPYAAGVCGLIASANPTWTSAQIKARLFATAQDIVDVESGAGWDRYTGYGMVDATAALDQITVTYPNGGEVLLVGTSVNITWTSIGSFSTVNIDYSANGGSSWTSVATGVANTGSYAWTVPTTETTQGRLRVSGGSASDASNANFTVSVPPAGNASMEWTRDWLTTTGWYPSTVVEPDQTVNMAFMDSTHVLMLGMRTPCGFVYEYVAGDNLHYAGYASAIAVGPQRVLGIVYLRERTRGASLYDVYYIRGTRTATGYHVWSAPIPLAAVNKITQLGIAFDAAGTAHIVYNDLNGLEYYYITATPVIAGPMVISTLPEAGRQSCSIAIDPQGAPCVAFAINNGTPPYYVPALGYTSRRWGGWTDQGSQTISSTCGIGAALALDAAGQPRIACESSSGRLTYVTWSSATQMWTFTTATTLVPEPRFALALNPAGLARIAFWATGAGPDMPTYVRETTTLPRWEASVFDSACISGNYSALGIGVNSDGSVVIGFANYEGNKYSIAVAQGIDGTPDVAPPAAITTLAVDMGKTTAVPYWTATGDDGTVGTAANYDVRCSRQPINGDAGFAAATPVLGTACPLPAGNNDCTSVAGLTKCVGYYFAVKVRDNAGNWSPMSNVAYGITHCSGFEVACEPGGGLNAARPVHGDDPAPAPAVLSFSVASPNPTRGDVSLRLGIPLNVAGTEVRVGVYDAQGRLIRSVLRETAASGDRRLSWDLRAGDGSRVRHGVYFVRMQLGAKTLTRSLIVLD